MSLRSAILVESYAGFARWYSFQSHWIGPAAFGGRPDSRGLRAL